MCRDYAHLVLALLRARDVPARLVAVYAPGLSPMDFHAVVEAWVDGEWRLLDATGLAPRASMLRIATGRDAADTAFLSVHHGQADLLTMSVVAVVDALPDRRPGRDGPARLTACGPRCELPARSGVGAQHRDGADGGVASPVQRGGG